MVWHYRTVVGAVVIRLSACSSPGSFEFHNATPVASRQQSLSELDDVVVL